MYLAGFQKLTLLDFPGKIACTAFTQGCVFACPFCHNPGLTGRPKQVDNQIETNFWDYLEKRKNTIEGVCITGGEPTLQKDLDEFLEKIKNLGYSVKLDTNGFNPIKLLSLIEKGLVDYVAMDIKHTKEKYQIATGKPVNISQIEKSVSVIMNSGISYEFRTTVVPSIHEEKDFEEIGNWISGAQNYYLQKYRDTEIVSPDLRECVKKMQTLIDLEKIKHMLSDRIKNVQIRQY